MTRQNTPAQNQKATQIRFTEITGAAPRTTYSTRGCEMMPRLLDAAESNGSQHDVVTVVADPIHKLGKQFFVAADGTVHKQSAVSVAVGLAVQHNVPNAQALRSVLQEVGNNPNAALINSRFPMFEIGEYFLILSELEFEKRGISRYDSSVNWPVQITLKDKTYPAIGRFKEFVQPSSWQLLDRDVDQHTPERYANLSHEGWLCEVDKLIPGVSACARLHAHSSSSRVLLDGTPASSGNGHTWVQVANPMDVERMRTSILPRALSLGMAWAKPRLSRTTGAIIGQSLATIVDPATLVRGRFVFCGKPEVHRA